MLPGCFCQGKRNLSLYWLDGWELFGTCRCYSIKIYLLVELLQSFELMQTLCILKEKRACYFIPLYYINYTMWRNEHKY